MDSTPITECITRCKICGDVIGVLSDPVCSKRQVCETCNTLKRNTPVRSKGSSVHGPEEYRTAFDSGWFEGCG